MCDSKKPNSLIGWIVLGWIDLDVKLLRFGGGGQQWRLASRASRVSFQDFKIFISGQNSRVGRRCQAPALHWNEIPAHER